MTAAPIHDARESPQALGLSIEALAVARGGMTVLSGVSAVVPPGGALILRGPNGSGKTTLLRTLAGLQPAISGRFIPGPDAIAYASHADGLKATLTVAENLRFWARLHGHGDIAPALDAFDLASIAGRAAGELSAGQKRRLGLARLALTRRPIWLLDEPTVSLDMATVARFAGFIRGHLAGGGIAVIATHIDLGLPEAQVLDVGAFAPSCMTAVEPHGVPASSDTAFAGADGDAFR